jgi:hypothetical protein
LALKESPQKKLDAHRSSPLTRGYKVKNAKATAATRAVDGTF